MKNLKTISRLKAVTNQLKWFCLILEEGNFYYQYKSIHTNHNELPF